MTALAYLLSIGLLVFPAQGTEIARWVAGDPIRAEGMSLVPGPDSSWKVGKSAVGYVAAVAPVNDYYHRAAYLVRVDKPVSGRVWLTVGYLDRGYGLISISTGQVSTSSGRTGPQGTGIARLNTGQLRRAVFRIDEPVFDHKLDRRLNPGADIRIVGAGFLHSLSLSDTQPPAEPIPEAKPALAFRLPGERVTSAGADADTIAGLPGALANLREYLPLVRALGFTSVESYVKWDFVERSPGVFDWSFYDAVADEVEKHGLKWFPFIIVGSAYTLPDWYYNSPELVGYECLEHGITNEIPTIFFNSQEKYVRRFLTEFGKHYGAREVMEGLRLGPSGNYGEAQYPSTGSWGYHGQPLHSHTGYWAGDPYASISFRSAMRLKYPTIADLNKAWGDHISSFNDIRTFLPVNAATPRKRIDFDDWYVGAMVDWSEKWALWAREAMPNALIYQSSGNWGTVDAGVNYTEHARSMAKIKGGVRMTNEGDNFAHNFSITRMAASATRFYGARLGFEPAGFGSARGVMARLFNAITTGAEHLFYYDNNLFSNDQAIDMWLQYAPLMDRRSKPMMDAAVYYPDTPNKLSDDVIRWAGSSPFYARVEALRSLADFDYMSERMIQDGALDRYKVLVFLWGSVTEKPIIDRIDHWVQAGGTLIYPGRAQARGQGRLSTVEGDSSVSRRWQEGETGKGRVIFFEGHPEPFTYYCRFVRDELRNMSNLRPEIRRALNMEKPPEVYWSVLSNGQLVLLNYGDDEAVVRLDGGKTLRLSPYAIVME